MMTGGAAEAAVCAGAGVTRSYVCPPRDQLFLMPVSMREWLEEEHLVWFVLEVVDELDTRGLHVRPGGSVGRPPYEPEMMCALLLYAYCCGVRSSRRIEAACRTDAAFRIICGGLEPDHATIARFVVDQERALADLFVAGVRLCASAGLVDLSVLALDGTKVAADAARSRNRDAVWIRREIERSLAATVQPEPCGLIETPLDLSLAAGEASGFSRRVARLQAALAVIEAEDAAQQAQAERLVDAAVAQAEHGRLRMGRKPTEPRAALRRAQIDQQVARARVSEIQAAIQAKREAAAQGVRLSAPFPWALRRAQEQLARAESALAAAQAALRGAAPRRDRMANVTDPESRIMKSPDGWVQGYNAQAIVNERHIVLACEVSQAGGDAELYEPMIHTLTQTLTAAGITGAPELMLADAGYWSEANATGPGPDRLIATLKDHKQRRAARQLGQTTGPPPPDATPLQEMEHLLRTPQGASAYAKRSCLIEPIFGDRKHNRHLRSFRRRGLNAARSEWAFAHLAGNLLKLYHHRATASA